MIVAAVTERLVNAVPPTAPVNAVVPDPPVIVRACAPLIVLLKLILALLEVILLVPVRLTALGKVRVLAPVTVMLFAI